MPSALYTSVTSSSLEFNTVLEFTLHTHTNLIKGCASGTPQAMSEVGLLLFFKTWVCSLKLQLFVVNVKPALAQASKKT